MRGGAMRSILIIGTLTLVGIAGLWFLFGDSTEVFELLYSSPTTIRIERDTIDLDIVRYGEKKQISWRIFLTFNMDNNGWKIIFSFSFWVIFCKLSGSGH